jgi:hypothetical protein
MKEELKSDGLGPSPDLVAPHLQLCIGCRAQSRLPFRDLRKM